MSKDEIPDFCPDFDSPDTFSALSNVPTSTIIQWLVKNRFEGTCIVAGIERKDQGHIQVKAMLKGKNSELEILLQDITAQVMKKISGGEHD